MLSTGIDGSGAWDVPAMIRETLPRARWAHTRDDIDFDALRGRRVGVLGAGASAFDNAAVALEHGAAEVHLYFRRKRLVEVNAYRWAEFVGFLKHMGDLPDADRWRFVRQIAPDGAAAAGRHAAPRERHPAVRDHPASPWTAVRMQADTIVVETPDAHRRARLRDRRHRLHHRFSPGAPSWPRSRPTSRSGAIATRRRRARNTTDLGRHPYLGPSFELVEKQPGTAPWVGLVHNYTFGCLLSLGFGGASISGMKYSVQRLVGGITRSLFEEDREHYRTLVEYDVEEFRTPEPDP